MTAKDLLYLVLDYQDLWSAPEVQQSRPAKVRVQQIEFLADKFGLTKKYVNPLVMIKYSITGNRNQLDRAQYLNKLTTIDYILKGEFLHDREKDINKELSEKARSKVLMLFPELADIISKKPVDMRWMFNDLFRFRREIYSLTRSNQGMLEGFSTGLHYSFYLQNQLSEIIRNNLSDIDDTLWLLLDPQKREFDKEKIGFPDADLESIDLEWRMDNY